MDNDLARLFDAAADLDAARTAAAKAADDIEFHTNELAVLAMNTASDHIRALCNCVTRVAPCATA